MLSKTHLTVGIASAIAFAQSGSVVGCFIAATGGALGGVAPDVDILNNDYQHDALIGVLLAVIVSITSAFVCQIYNPKVLTHFIDDRPIVLAGIIGYLIIAIRGYCSKHRTITHSIVALLFFSFPIYLICPPVTKFYMIGYCSHLILDVLNKKGIWLLFPAKKEICFNFCSASGKANTFFMYFGLVMSCILFGAKLAKLF